MKRYLLSIAAFIISLTSSAQAPFWTENFGTNPVCGSTLAAAFTSSNGAWTVTTTGTNDIFSNEWFVSPREAGMGVGNCGSSCSITPILINNTMHVSTTFSLGGDVGAAYAAGPGLANTNKRAQSPTINCSAKSSIILRFNYIMWGVINQDYAEVMYSPDNGSTWSALGIPPQTPTNTCAGQGIWTSYSVALPPSANNNTTVKIGFRWQNINANGADPSFAVDDITLTSSAAFTASFSLLSPICKNNSATVIANTGTTAATGYTWSANPSGPVISAPNVSITNITFPNAGTFSITLTAASGTNIATHTKTITVNPLPTITVNSPTVCSGGNLVFTASGATVNSWAGPNGFNSTVQNPTITNAGLIHNGCYTVIATGAFSCSNTAVSCATVYALPNITVSATSSSLCLGSVATLTASGASTYTWMPGSTSGNTLLITPTVNTTYTVNGSSAAGCTSGNTISITVITCTNTGIQNQSNVAIFEIYPNPVHDKLIFNSNTVDLHGYSVQITDVLGKVMMNINLTANSQEIPMTEFPKGVYLIGVLKDGKTVTTTKVIKE